MPNYVASITVDDVVTALANFIAPFVNGAQIVRGQINRVAYPVGQFVKLTEIHQSNLQFSRTVYEQTVDADSATILGPKKLDVQVDFYGPGVGEYCAVFKTAIQSQWGWDQFPGNIRPLYASEAFQIPLITGEQQYESRWTLTVSIQYNPNFTTPQQYASNATATLILADALTTDEV